MRKVKNSGEGKKNGKSKRVALGLSGGVDSSVAGLLLKKSGYDVTGVYLQCWDKKSDGCAADEDRAYAVQTAAKLGIKFLHISFIEEYKKKVIEYFFEEYRRGRTPNPDVMCNKEIKFGLFYNWALKEGFDYVATGHYARVSQTADGFNLLKGTDKSKDQSYFLYLLNRCQLENILFPVGDMSKKEVREIAEKENLPSAKRPDSVGICFIGEVNIKEFLKNRLPETAGNVLDTGGNIIGTHDGAWFYTIGQRHGFKLTKYLGKPGYVLSKNVEKNELVVGEENDVYTHRFYVADCHWISENPLSKSGNFSCEVRIRHLGKLYPCTISGEEYRVNVLSDERLFAVAEGQSAVFYREDVVLGGGVITGILSD